MNIFELIFFAVAISLAIAGGRYFGQWGLLSGIAGAAIGLAAPFIVSRAIIYMDEKRFSKTRQGRRRMIAEDVFDKSICEKRLKSLRFRPLIGNDGSTIVTIFYGNTKPPGRAFYRFEGDSMEPQKVSPDEAALYIDVKLWR